MKNVHLLPTDKPSRLWVNNLKRRLELDKDVLIGSNTAQHIYITNDEEIKAGDWYIFPLHKKGFAIKLYNSVEHFSKEPCISLANLKAKKIILTTDPSLAPDVQKIDDEFLVWFVKNPSCEEIETYSLGIKNEETGESCHYEYEIIIPKEEPDYTALLKPVGTKQTAVEWLIEKWSTQGTLYSSDIFQAKEMEKEQISYSKEEMLGFAWFLVKNIGQYSCDETAHFEGKYLEQFKNK